MGNNYSYLNTEKNTWIEHELKYDTEIRESNLNSLENFKDGRIIYLGFSESSWGGYIFKHWLITDKVNYIEFGLANTNIYTARVTINTLSHENLTIDYKDDITRKSIMNDVIRQRMKQLLGMSNYSLCLRNSEHVANYIFHGRWLSLQMLSDESNQGEILKSFCKHLIGVSAKLINTFPSTLQPYKLNNDLDQIYKFNKKNAIAKSIEYYLDSDENTYNILFIGPTGAGKSHLINILFNSEICKSEASYRSITRDVYFIRGKHKIYNKYKQIFEERNIIVADTIGLCDTEWNDEKIINLIKNRISSNFKFIDKVLIVIPAGRLQQHVLKNVKVLMDWLNYGINNAHLFKFVCSKADYLNEDEIIKMKIELKEILETHGIKYITGSDQLIYVGFPSENTLNENTTQNVLKSFNELNKTMNHSIKRINIKAKTSNGICLLL